eukprot:gnl/TRDRNA2_/TRDRNA2_100018_c0_seq1.p1 gnl/TRDRNA2_/TRDRNA2_100018_c0~~gnl/TRDRNA2_/TRDRNA2_100018_c0_seq1.p1  ORF type:complete len:334 (+),score=43.89 gnl/TRDRNA2_/TRDRNA2_100018_c0_seq1:1-1002(+)
MAVISVEELQTTLETCLCKFGKELLATLLKEELTVHMSKLQDDLSQLVQQGQSQSRPERFRNGDAGRRSESAQVAQKPGARNSGARNGSADKEAKRLSTKSSGGGAKFVITGGKELSGLPRRPSTKGRSSYVQSVGLNGAMKLYGFRSPRWPTDPVEDSIEYGLQSAPLLNGDTFGTAPKKQMGGNAFVVDGDVMKPMNRGGALRGPPPPPEICLPAMPPTTERQYGSHVSSISATSLPLSGADDQTFSSRNSYSELPGTVSEAREVDVHSVSSKEDDEVREVTRKTSAATADSRPQRRSHKSLGSWISSDGGSETKSTAAKIAQELRKLDIE